MNIDDIGVINELIEDRRQVIEFLAFSGIIQGEEKPKDARISMDRLTRVIDLLNIERAAIEQKLAEFGVKC